MKDLCTSYLCQVSEKVSCGACCGLYNIPNLSPEGLKNLLIKRTADFSTVARNEDELLSFKRKNKGPARLTRPYPEFHHCPFLGLLGNGKSRVGCLLHPAAPGNANVDYRSLSWYGERACRSYFCPATGELSHLYQEIVKQTMDNWYHYGLIVTEHTLLTAYFKEMELRIGRKLRLTDYTENIEAVNCFREFVELKFTWPYRRDKYAGPCNFFFANGLYPRPAVFHATPPGRPSKYDIIFKELETSFASVCEIRAAEQILNKLFGKAERAIA